MVTAAANPSPSALPSKTLDSHRPLSPSGAHSVADSTSDSDRSAANTNRERNRIHARQSRLRRKMLTQTLQHSVATLTLERDKLREQVLQVFGVDFTVLLKYSSDAALAAASNTIPSLSDHNNGSLSDHSTESKLVNGKSSNGPMDRLERSRERNRINARKTRLRKQQLLDSLQRSQAALQTDINAMLQLLASRIPPASAGMPVVAPVPVLTEAALKTAAVDPLLWRAAGPAVASGLMVPPAAAAAAVAAAASQALGTRAASCAPISATTVTVPSMSMPSMPTMPSMPSMSNALSAAFMDPMAFGVWSSAFGGASVMGIPAPKSSSVVVPQARPASAFRAFDDVPMQQLGAAAGTSTASSRTAWVPSDLPGIPCAPAFHMGGSLGLGLPAMSQSPFIKQFGMDGCRQYSGM